MAFKGRRNKEPKTPPRPKKEFWVGDLKFDSGEEMRYYLHLEAEQGVKSIVLQPEFEVMPKYSVRCFRCQGKGSYFNETTTNFNKCQLCKGNGVREGRAIMYTADFQVEYADGYIEIVDVKGTHKKADNPTFSMRKKLFEAATGTNLVVIREGTKELRGQFLRDEK